MLRTSLLAGAAVLLLLAAAAPAGAAERTYRFTSKPVTISGFDTAFPRVYVPTPGVTGHVTFMDTRLVDMRGRRVPLAAVMLHHVVYLNRGGPGRWRSYRGSCEGRHGQPFFGTGEEREQLRLPRGYGYPVRSDDRWWMQAMLMSHTLRARTVRVEYTVRVATGERLTPVRPFWIRANGCSSVHPSYSVDGGGAEGSTSRRSWTWKLPISGRIVAAGGHLHGGARRMALTEPRCGDRELLHTDPLYGTPRDRVYTLKPILHEPGPIATNYFMSRTGIPVARGQNLTLTGEYDGQWPRARVMSIMHVYVARGPAPKRSCRPLPRDVRGDFLGRRGRREPPYVRVPFNVLDDLGRIRAVDTLPGAPRQYAGNVTVTARGNRFTPRKISVPSGARIRWRFMDREAHNVLYASGPAIIGTPTLKNGRSKTIRVTKPGTYQAFCYLHPLTMHEEIVVRPR